MAGLRPIAVCKRARVTTSLRARAIVCVALTERMIFETNKHLRILRIGRPL